MVLKHNFEGGHAVYELDRGEHHDHMVDVDTGKVIEFADEEFEELARVMARRLGFVLVGQRLELFGRRAEPAAAEAPAKRRKPGREP